LDIWRVGGLALDHFPVQREAPPAFSVDRPLPVRYRWTNPASRPLELRVREALPPLLEAAHGAERRVILRKPETTETIMYLPRRRGKATGGRLYLRVLGPLGLVWRQGSRELPWQIVVYPSLRSA